MCHPQNFIHYMHHWQSRKELRSQVETMDIVLNADGKRSKLVFDLCIDPILQPLEGAYPVSSKAKQSLTNFKICDSSPNTQGVHNVLR